MRETQIMATLLHRDHADCPEGPRTMMNDANHVGCSNGNTCPAPRQRGLPARAVFYARHSKINGKKREARAMYFCAHCAKAFANRFGLEYAMPGGVP